MAESAEPCGLASVKPTVSTRRATYLSDNPNQRIVKFVHHPLLQRNNGVIRNVNIFRADLRATFRDVAKPDAQLILQQLRPRNAIHRMHFQSRHAHKKSRSAKLLVLVMVS